MADEIEKRAEPLALTNTRENGSPVTETRGAAASAAGILRYFASLADQLEKGDVRPFPAGGAEYVVRRDPVGTCVLIAPWNFPINLVGDALVRHPLTAKVAFTGSTPVGRKIAAACGELLRPVTLELGGKSSAIVLPDADLEQMSGVLIRSCMRNTGQTCYIFTRILAPAERYDEVVDMVTSTIAAAKQGDPIDDGTVFGPLASEAQHDIVLGYLESAAAEGARVTTGGRKADRPGFFVEPSVLADVTPEMRVAREEIFGPVVTILRYETLDEALEIANTTGFGLGGLVFSADPEAALAVADRMDTGSVGLNFFASNHSAPFGGRHDSGLGVEYGLEGLSAYLTYKSIHRRPSPWTTTPPRLSV